MSVADREAEVAAAIKAWDALPVVNRAPASMRDRLADLQADYVSAALGLEVANAEIERLYIAHPGERPIRG